MHISLEQLDALLKTLEDKKVAEFEYEDETIRLRVALGRAATIAPSLVVPNLSVSAPGNDVAAAALYRPYLSA